ncbi:ABC transporter permease [Acinetobacter sp. WZC-1]|uniref:ABC transporter permease n=1 Tax=Acinetobacter sp. WZC-1 TaxID=3459034 RepID=UPI00403E115A
MNWIRSELRFILRSKLSVIALVFLATLAGLSVWFGLQEVHKQQQTIARLAPLHEQDVRLVSSQLFQDPRAGGDAGSAAYYTFYYTWDQPSRSAFAALGLRDVAPYVLRVRALGLQSQLYDGEVFNPELVLPGRFDFAFVLIYLSPLFIIALMHDLVSSERQAGRLPLLLSLPEFGKKRWIQRIMLRYSLVFAALGLPFIAGAIFAGTPLLSTLSFLLIILAYLAFWFGLNILIASRQWLSVANATALVGTWVILTLILPTLVNLLLIRSVPVVQGVDLMLQQRDNIHGAWEIPRETTMQNFFKHHPEWKNTAPLPSTFHWKWYLAFHQVGDESVEPLFRQYRHGLETRQQWTNYLGWILPGVAAQSALHQLAHTDLDAQLDYQDQIIAFHEKIRNFYYPYLFNDTPFTRHDFDQRPSWQAIDVEPAFPGKNTIPFILISFIIFLLSLKIFKVQSPRVS